MSADERSWEEILATAKQAADELRNDGQAAVWIRGEVDDNAAKAERIEGQVAGGYGAASDDEVAVALTELAEAHRAAAELLKWRAEQSAKKHRGEVALDRSGRELCPLSARIEKLKGDLASREETQAEIRASLQQDIAWLELLQRFTGLL